MLLGVGLYLATMHSTVQTLLGLRQLGPTLPHPPPCTWTLSELEALADQRSLAIEVLSPDGRYTIGSHAGAGAPTTTRASTLRLRHRCVQVLLTVRAGG